MPQVRLTPIPGVFKRANGIDYHEPSKSFLLSVNYPTGMPFNFELLAADGSRKPFTNIRGFTNEVKVATVRSGSHLGGFSVGEAFTGNGKPGQIVRISPDGKVVKNPWVTLNDKGLLRGSLFQDRYGVFGGDLIVVTTKGGVWRVTSGGAAKRLANLRVHLEGVTTVPNLPARYGPWAGRIIVGAEQQEKIHAVAADGKVQTFSIGVSPEDIEIIPAGESFLGVDYEGQVLQWAPAAQFTDMEGDFLIPQEVDGVLWHVRWDPGRSSFKSEQVAKVAHWEHVAFAPIDMRVGVPGMTVDKVFQFVALRPAERTTPGRVAARFARYSDQDARSPLHQQVEALTGEDRRGQAVALALQYMDSEAYVGAAPQPVVNAATQASGTETVADAKTAAAAVLGADSLDEYLSSEEAATLRDRLWDSLYAQTLAPDARPDDRNRINAGARALHYLGRLVEQDDAEPPAPADALRALRLAVPAGIVPPAGPPGEDPGTGEVIQEVINRLEALHEQVTATSAAINDLQDVDRGFRSERLRQFPAAELDLSASTDVETPIPQQPLASPVLRVPPAFVVAGPNLTGRAADEAGPVLEMRSITIPASQPWVFSEEGQARLKAETRALLQQEQAAFQEQEPADIVAILEGRMSRQTTAFLENLPPRAAPYVVEREELREIAALVPIPLAPFPLVNPDPFPEPESPAARGIRPLGVGDLLVVQQELLRYSPGEVAHIENVLQSESKTRTHKRTRETEEILVVETEELEETERDLQSTERFELQKETERTVESELDVEAGLSVTASYGFVSATATADFAYNQSRSESNRVASQFARETVDRSVSRIMQRTREERTRRTLERFEEVNEHGLDNSKGTGNITGVYRWVDKFYKARMVNYGRRLMMEFIVPEPAAFYLHTQSVQPLAGVTLTRPVEPRIWGQALRPDHLTATNFQEFVARYQATDVTPYPSPTTRVGAAFAEAPNPGEAKNVDYAKTSEALVVPAGYRAIDVYGQSSFQGYKGYFGSCLVAGESFGSITAYQLEGIIPISVIGFLSAFHVNLVAQCEMLPATKSKWQLDTYEAIMTAYQRALSEYNEQVTAAQVQAGIEIAGRNPALNRGIEATELKKAGLRLLTDEWGRTRVGGNWRFDELFNAMQPSGTFGFPEFDVDEALVEGQIIQFFEQAFEWNNMTYRFYPYFWGRKANWKVTLPLDDTDPQFADFLRAGAARMIVPVHPAYVEAMLHYLYTNEIWNGDQPPTLDDPLFISIVDEIRADTEADIAAVLPRCDDSPEYPCVVSEWEVKVPTSLVYLQQDATLPGHDGDASPPTP